MINGKSSLEALPETIKNIYVYASETQLDSIFLNLITNSYKSFKSPNKINHRIINISLEVMEDTLIKITYEDNGNGLNKKIENPNFIFEPYKSYNKGGTGMGMSILSSVVSNLKEIKSYYLNLGKEALKLK